MLVSAFGCRRHPSADAGDTGIPGDDGGLGGDHTGEMDAPPPPDGSDRPDGPGTGDATDAPTVMALPCGMLRPLANLGPITSRHARKVLFSPDRRVFVMQAAGVTPAPDDLLAVPLPGGAPQTLIGGVADIEWLGDTGTLLVTLATGDLAVVSLDGTPARTIASHTCGHLAVPDGSRVFVLRDCNAARPAPTTTGALDEVSVATGTATPRAALALADWAVSPSGRFAAFVAPTLADAGSGGGGVLHVLDGASDRALVQAPAAEPAFVSDQRLLFLAAAQPYEMTDAYVHVPGSGDGSQRVAQGRHFGLRGYRISPDGSTVLAALLANASPWNDTLYAERLDGTGEQVLAPDLLPYHQFQLALTPFAFSRDGSWTIFMPNANVAATRGVFAISPTGDNRHLLAKGSAFAVSPFSDRVAVLEISTARDLYTVHFVVAATGAEQFEITSSSAVSGFRFVPDSRGFLYVQIPTTGPSQLYHVSFIDAQQTPLGAWNQTTLPIGDYPSAEIVAGYPVDPTGCFTVVDSDIAGSVGTSLVVLPDAPG
jgi:hypothetical protein